MPVEHGGFNQKLYDAAISVDRAAVSQNHDLLEDALSRLHQILSDDSEMKKRMDVETEMRRSHTT